MDYTPGTDWRGGHVITGNAVWVILPEFLLLFGALTTYTFGRVGRQKGSWYTGGIATLFAIATLGVLISAIPAVQGGESLVVTLNPSGIALALTPLALFLGLYRDRTPHHQLLLLHTVPGRRGGGNRKVLCPPPAHGSGSPGNRACPRPVQHVRLL